MTLGKKYRGSVRRAAMLCVALFGMLSLYAQEVYDMADIAFPELNGTARYVGSAGALDALGNELSSLSVNPASIAGMHSNLMTMSMSMVSQSATDKSRYGGRVHPSVDQFGVVYRLRNRLQRTRRRFFIGFQYRKSRDFNQILRMDNVRLDGQASRVTATVEKSHADLQLNHVDGILLSTTLRPYTTLQPDGSVALSEDSLQGKDLTNLRSDSYSFDFNRWGYIGQYDFSFAWSLNDRLYMGACLQLHEVHYHSRMAYTERLLTDNVVEIDEARKISGEGLGFLVGMIARPWRLVPLSIGLNLQTPIYYKLTNSTELGLMYDGVRQTVSLQGGAADRYQTTYDYDFTTPWSYGISIGYVVRKRLSLGLAAQMTNYAAMRPRRLTAYNTQNESRSTGDAYMRDRVHDILRAVCTLRIGAEYLPAYRWRIRCGYNLVTPMYQSGSTRDYPMRSEQETIRTTADNGVALAPDYYDNRSAVHRLAVGGGYIFPRLNIDMAYQLAGWRNRVRPFYGAPIRTSYFIRHQLLVTLAYHF
ncbi:MAG: hypothetical protein IJ680_00815 [Paludibacteraceae bacterium]|nr:hypothetical protein [Paludibacteraceae bacterium]